MRLMKHRAALAPAITAGMLLAAPALAQTMPPAVISVTGEATVSVAPDLAQIEAGVTSDAKTAREASDANNAAMGKVLLALKGAGIEEKDFQTSRLSLQPQYAPNRSGPSPVVGYRASNRVTVRIRDVTKVASIIDVNSIETCSTQLNVSFLGSLSSTMLVRVRIRSSIFARVTGLTVELTSRRCSSCSGGSMRMKLVRSMPFGASLIMMPPTSSDEEKTLWFTSTWMMSLYFTTDQYGPYGLSLTRCTGASRRNRSKYGCQTSS